MWLLLLHQQPNLKCEFQPCSSLRVYDMPTLRPNDERAFPDADPAITSGLPVIHLIA
jgi:hypothetical protein